MENWDISTQGSFVKRQTVLRYLATRIDGKDGSGISLVDGKDGNAISLVDGKDGNVKFGYFSPETICSTSKVPGSKVSYFYYSFDILARKLMEMQRWKDRNV